MRQGRGISDLGAGLGNGKEGEGVRKKYLYMGWDRMEFNDIVYDVTKHETFFELS
jgi:hypothetical protein